MCRLDGEHNLGLLDETLAAACLKRQTLNPAQVVNVLDDVHNPGLRETIKEFSQWPTIPQVRVEGGF